MGQLPTFLKPCVKKISMDRIVRVLLENGEESEMKQISQHKWHRNAPTQSVGTPTPQLQVMHDPRNLEVGEGSTRLSSPKHKSKTTPVQGKTSSGSNQTLTPNFMRLNLC